MRTAAHVAEAAETGGKRKAIRYQCACLDEFVYLHPQSALYSAAPEFVVYSQLFRSTKRPYMTGKTHSKSNPSISWSLWGLEIWTAEQEMQQRAMCGKFSSFGTAVHHEYPPEGMQMKCKPSTLISRRTLLPGLSF